VVARLGGGSSPSPPTGRPPRLVNLKHPFGMSADLAGRVETACDELVAKGETVMFAAVARGAGLAKATLYRRPELRAIVELTA
jgi:hypothetical protein